MKIFRGIRKCLAWAVLTLAVLLPGLCKAQINLASPEDSQIVAPHATVYWQAGEDWDPDARIDEVALPFVEVLRLAEDGAFEPVATRNIGFGLAIGIAHVRVPLFNPSEETAERVLAFNRNFEGWYRAHLVIEGQPPPETPILDFFSYSNEWPTDPQLSVNLALPAGTSGHLYLSFFNAELSVPLTVDTEEYYRAKRSAQDIHFFVIVGVLVGLTFITAALMITMRRYVAVYYVGAVVSGVIFVLLIENRLHNTFDFVPALFIAGGPIYILMLNLVFVLLFQRSFFEIDTKRTQTMRRLLLWMVLAYIASTLFYMNTGLISLLFFIVLAIGGLVIVFVNAVIAVLHGYVGRWPFLLGSTVFLLSLSFKLLAFQFSWLITDREASLVFLYAIAFESAALAIAMFLQIGALRRQKLEALQAQSDLARDKLELAQSMAHAAHDIRQPLTSLRITLADQASSARQASEIEGAIDYLDGIVQSQLQGSRKQVAASEGDLEVFEMDVVLSNVATMFREEAEAKGLALRVVPNSLKVRSNVFAVMRVLSNIVANAIRNTQTGQILVGVRRDGRFARVEVRDTGPGMRTEDQAAFEADGVRGGSYAGEGLGLNIVRGISDELGLDLVTHSVVGRGTTVTFRLPRVVQE